MDALRNLELWRRACRFSVGIYKITDGCRDRDFRSQVTRATLSVASNVAEVYERDSRRERIRFLFIAKGSCGECGTQLPIGVEAGFVSKDSAKALILEAEELAKMLRGRIGYFEAKES